MIIIEYRVRYRRTTFLTSRKVDSGELIALAHNEAITIAHEQRTFKLKVEKLYNKDAKHTNISYQKSLFQPNLL